MCWIAQHIAQDNLVFKRFAFQFVNKFVGLLYVTFYMQDMDRLRSLLASLLISGAVVNNLMELFQAEAVGVIEYLRRRWMKVTTPGAEAGLLEAEEWVGKSLDQDMDR